MFHNGIGAEKRGRVTFSLLDESPEGRSKDRLQHVIDPPRVRLQNVK
jgi:hypothetical protein